MRKMWIGAISAISAGIAGMTACSSSTSPNSTLTLAQTYHLRVVDGRAVPFVGAQGNPTDSGTFTRASGDTIDINDWSTVPPSGGNPGITVIGRGIYRGVQTGNTVVLLPVIATSTDTATVSGDSLTLRTRAGGALHVELFVSP